MVAFRLAAGQAGLGHEPHLASCVGQYVKPGTLGTRRTEASEHATRHAVERALKDVPWRDRIRRHDFAAPSFLERVLATQARARLSKLMADVDVLHLHAIWDPIILAAAAEARRRRLPYVVVLNGVLDPWSLAQHRWKKRLALLLSYRAMLNGAAALHVANPIERDLIGGLGLTSPTRIIPNGIFLGEFDHLPPRGTFRALHPQLHDRPYVLFMSRLHPKKGLDLLAEAFARIADVVPELMLVVVGPDDGALAPFQRQIRRLRIDARVLINGPLYGPDKLAALVDASCYCLPSRQEGFSLAITEALACGTAVVVSDASHFPEIAAVGAGLVVPLDVGEIANAIVRVVRDPDLAAAMGRAGRHLVESRFTWPRIAELTIETYRAALAARYSDVPAGRR
jgi:glycosyltransferase involved in cell wall biosynthesis